MEKEMMPAITVVLTPADIEAIASAVARKLQMEDIHRLPVARSPLQGARCTEGKTARSRNDEKFSVGMGNKAPTPTPYLTEQEAAEYLTKLGMHFSPRTLQKQRVTGGGIPFVKFKTRVRYRKEDLDAWVESSPVRKSTSDLHS